MRQLLCIPCGKDFPRGTYVHQREHHRVIEGIVAKPRAEQRIMHVNGQPHSLAGGHYDCDFCNAELKPGARAVAVTVWVKPRPEPENWEAGYFAPAPDEISPLVSTEPTPWAVECRTHRMVYLTEAEYNRQMRAPDSFWICPRCGERAHWNDDNYEKHMDAREAASREPEPDDGR